MAILARSLETKNTSRFQTLRALKRQEVILGFLFIAPNLISFAVFLLGPIIASFVLSFTDWDLIQPPEFVGVSNYTRMMNDPQLWVSLGNTLKFALLSIPLGVVISLGLALAMNQRLKGISLYRTAFFVPVVASTVAVAMVWRWILNTEFGILNHVLGVFGVPSLSWLSNPGLVIPSIVLVAVWKNMGYNMVLFLAGLKAIPQHLYEAAAIDGASPVQRFRFITLPLLTPTLFFITVLSVIGSFQVFDIVFIMTGGGPGDASRVYYYWLWQNAFKFFRMGYASAMAWVLFAALFVMTLIQLRFLGKRVQYEMG